MMETSVFQDMVKHIRVLTPFDYKRLEHIPMETTEDNDGHYKSTLYWKELNGALYLFDYKSELMPT